MSYQSAPINTPTTKPSVPTCDPPDFILPPSLPKQSFLPADGSEANAQNDNFGSQSVARSLTNNDHSAIPQSLGQGGIKMGQSPTIFSMLSGGNVGSMVASSRTYVSTSTPGLPSASTYQQQSPPHPQQPYQAQYNNVAHFAPPQANMNDEEDDLDDGFDDDFDGDMGDVQALQFDFDR